MKCRSVTNLILAVHQDTEIDASSLSKFMALCSSLNLPSLVASNNIADQDLNIQMEYLYEEARLATWFNTAKNNDPVISMLKLLAESELASKRVQAGPYGTESIFSAPSLNIFI